MFMRVENPKVTNIDKLFEGSTFIIDGRPDEVFMVATDKECKYHQVINLMTGQMRDAALYQHTKIIQVDCVVKYTETVYPDMD